MKRALVLVAAVLVLAGCGSGQNSADGSPDAASPSPSASTSTAAGGETGGTAKGEANPATDTSGEAGDTAKQPAKLTRCGLTETDIAYMQRDWERVVGSIGRGDHGKYTHAFVARLDSLKEQSKACPADQALARFIAAAERVDKAAKKPNAGYGIYRKAADSGNAWLDQVGITPNELAAG